MTLKKLISWNVNGLRACVKKGFLDYFNEMDADIFCVQETKLQEGQIDLELEGYYDYWNYAEKKGYSGTAVFTKEKPISVKMGLGIEEHDNAGFSDEERSKMSELLNSGFTDTFRYFYPDIEGVYSWWSYRFNARANNAGWRIDYFIVSQSLNDKLEDAKIHTSIEGSDHCPVELEINL